MVCPLATDEFGGRRSWLAVRDGRAPIPHETDRGLAGSLLRGLPRSRDVRDRHRVFGGPREAERAAPPDRGWGCRPPRDGRSDVADRDGPLVGPDGTAGHR